MDSTEHHHDRATVLGREALPDVDEQAFSKVLSLLRQLLEEIHANFNGPGQLHFPERIGDSEALMKLIRNGHEAHQAEVASQIL